MAENIVRDMLSGWALWLVLSVAGGLLLTYVTVWAPRAAGQRARKIPEAGQQPAPAPAAALDTAVQIEVETAMAAALSVHTDRIDGAHKHLLEARVGTTDERLASLDLALELVEEAAVARADSYQAAETAAHVHLARADLVDDDAAVDVELRKAAEAFLRTTELRPRELDAFLGAGALWIRLGRRWHGPEASSAFDLSAATYARAFELARNNVALMKGWGSALDGLHRLGVAEYETRRLQYDTAMSLHRDGDHELREWFAGILLEPEPPPAPGVEPFTTHLRMD